MTNLLKSGVALAASLVFLFAGSALAAKPDASRLSLRAEAQLEKAKSEGKATVTVMIASQPGANAQVASGLAGLGAVVRYREESMSYIRARVPVDKVEAAAALPGVKYLDVDEVIPLPDPRPEGIAPLVPQPAPGAATPNNNPYMPIGETGASQFMAAHPTWDGRGVTIGIVDAGVTLDHPSLLTTSTGEPKIIDWVTGTDPFDDDDPTWLDMSAQVSGATFVFGGQTYTAPYAGSFRIGLFNERDPRLGGPDVGNDVNRDGNPAGSSGIFAVLWDAATGVVWVDTNQNRNFADEMAMRDYKINRDVNYFGTDNPATAIAERMPFVVQTDGKNKVVNIGIASSGHASHVAGIATGNALFGGAMSGAAPGAKIVSLRACMFITGCTAHALLEGMIFVAKQANVDVINMSIGGLPALNDGNNARAELYNRLIEQYNVQMFLSAGNSGPGMNTIGDPSVATKAMSVGSYLSGATMLADYGAVVGHADNLHYFTSRGPREDGGFKPQIVAPGAAISTTPMWQAGVGLPYVLPPGYQLMNGTSMASPQAAGAAALLISAAKQSGAQKQPAQIRQALNSSARLLDGPVPSRLPIFAQGNGLINVGAAWDLLKTNIKLSEISGTVPVSTALGDFLATPNVGTGIYDREGVTTGSAYTRTYTFVRTKGGSKPVTYNVSWVGNDGTFSSPATLSLPANTPVALTVAINPLTAGAHSAILNIDDPSTTGIDYQTMNVVVATDPFNAAGGFAVTRTSTIDRAQQTSYFFDVPTGVPAFKVDFSGPSATPGTGQARFLRWHPWGLGIDSNAVSNCYTPTRRQLRYGERAQPHDHQSAGGCLGGHGRRAAQFRCRQRPLHAGRLDPRRFGLAESRCDRYGNDRRADCAELHADQPLWCIYRSRSRRRQPGQRHARHADDREFCKTAVPGGRDGGIDVAPRDDRQSERPRGRPRSVRLQLHDGAVRPGRTVGRRRLRGVGHDRESGGG